MSIIVCNCQHCDEQQFQTLSCVHYMIFSVVILDLFIKALLLDRILALEKTTRFVMTGSIKVNQNLNFIFLTHPDPFVRMLHKLYYQGNVLYNKFY